MEVLQHHISEVSLFTVTAVFPAGSFEEETVDVGTDFGVGGVLSDVLTVLDVSLQEHVIERQVVGTGRNLHHSGQEGHRVEESGNPQNRRSLHGFGPVNQLGHTFEHVSEPVRQ